jgi:hypothetical protein
MHEHTAAAAGAVLDVVGRWQSRFSDALGRRLAFAADEYYVLAGRPFPDSVDYEGFPQHENGIGMARAFEADVRAALAGVPAGGHGPRAGFFAWVDGAPADGYRAPRVDDAPRPTRSTGAPAARVAIVTGQYGEQVLTPLLPLLRTATESAVRLVPVRNAFFGGNIAVTGLLTGATCALPSRRSRPAIAICARRRAVAKCLDGMAVEGFPSGRGRPTDGASLVAALRCLQRCRWCDRQPAERRQVDAREPVRRRAAAIVRRSRASPGTARSSSPSGRRAFRVVQGWIAGGGD